MLPPKRMIVASPRVFFRKNMNEDIKRLFFGLDVKAPWPEKNPSGRLLLPDDRHLTLIFLGNVSYSELSSHKNELPSPFWTVGKTGYFSECLFLPKRKSHCVSWNVTWTDDPNPIENFRIALQDSLHLFRVIQEKRREFLPHVTLARAPFSRDEWKKSFQAIPMYTTSFCLYESIGNLQYKKIWTESLLPPFEEIEHTADLAFRINAESLQELYTHALCALQFNYRSFLVHADYSFIPSNVDDIIRALNELVTKTDTDMGSPLKAVSYHGNCTKINSLYQWEMIVDV